MIALAADVYTVASKNAPIMNLEYRSSIPKKTAVEQQ